MPHRTPVEELQDLAEAQYRRKDYAAALLSVDEAIEQDRTSIRLFDTRAAIYEKLDDFVSALKDARAQIKLDEKDPRGYLRAGKVLIKMSKHEVALELYKRGISKSVRDVDTLQKMHDRLLKSLTPPTFVDPLASLPLEIFEIIMLKLRFGQMLYIRPSTASRTTLLTITQILYACIKALAFMHHITTASLARSQSVKKS